MPRIVLCCAAGMSTSMLVNKMKAEAQQRALALEIYAVAVAEFERELPNADVILLGPQVKYEAGRLTALAAPPMSGWVSSTACWARRPPASAVLPRRCGRSR
ncbi:PTS system protein [Klebsiella pneumoniae]|nr:PTS system protein [Klebsiella pneumoniae]SWN94424.1 PTS system protein [Klebsiella pneumoniae]SYJ06169.1 PTS system protein [Klebsiella pneumoniae]SYS35172.1 PTS system protein [Klebsiella pneumoniae]SYT52210.1 PTS system protein [Klebsiella pneumoniae]